MSLLLLGACLTVIVYAATSAVGAALSAATFRIFEPWIEGLEPLARARALFRLRLLPAGLATALTAGLFLPAFLLLEPRDAVEDVSAGLAVLAVAALAVVLRGPVTAARDWARTRALVRGWLRRSEPLHFRGAPAPAHLVDTPFPVVATFGIWGPRLLVARTVRESCTDEELAAILAHERAHLAHRDGLKRILFRGAPDPLAGTRIGARFESAWSEAMEDSADEVTQPALALALASALVKVSKLAVDAKPVPALASALYRRGGIDRRVRRLTAKKELRPLPHSTLLPYAVGGAVAALGLAIPTLELLPRVHRLTEAFVALLQ